MVLKVGMNKKEISLLTQYVNELRQTELRRAAVVLPRSHDETPGMHILRAECGQNLDPCSF